jgi:hypothetical protein
MAPFDPEHFVRDLVKLFQLSITQKQAQVLDIFCFFKLAGDRQFLLFLFNLIPIVVPDRYVSSLLLHLPGIDCHLVDDRLFREEFVRWKLDRVLCRQHVAYRLLRLD